MPRPNYLVTVEFHIAASDANDAADQVVDHQLVKGFKNWEIVETVEE